ncbi:tetratricopeptide repeat protein [Lutimonas sp.]|uniref:tetratricopeptide repeat protein n=1 Tax=Lutimonas sp. TaxID=1872403 RepID=UPI003C765781
MKWNNLISELKRRHVFKSTIAYLAISWIVIQIASILLPALDAPDTALKTLIYILAAGLVLWIGFSWYYDLTRDGIQKTDDIDTSPESLQLANRRLNKVIAGSLSVGVLLLLVISFWAGSNWNEGPTIPEVKKVAVIPFSTSMANKEEVYYQTGLTDELIDELSKMDQLKVIRQRSTKVLTSGFDQTNSLILNVIKGIDYFVEGTFERETDGVHVHIILRESINGEPVWQKRYTKAFSEVQTLWVGVAADLASQMGLAVRPANVKFGSGRDPVDPEAYALYLKGKYYLNKSTPADWERGLVYLQEALDRNPADANTWAWLSQAYINLGHGNGVPDVFSKALEAAERAIEIDSTLALGWASLSQYHTYVGRDWAVADYAFNRANALDPNLAGNHFHRSWYLALFGRMNEAIEEHKLAQELDPFTPAQTAWLGELYRWVGMYEEGLEQTERASLMGERGDFDYAVGMFIQGRIYIDQGKMDEGLELLKQCAELNLFWRYPGYGGALFETGHIEKGKAILNELEQAPPGDWRDFFIGIYYAYLGDYDKSFEYWKIDNKAAWFPWLRVMFLSDEIRKDPRFIQLMRDMNLPDPAPLVYDPEL